MYTSFRMIVVHVYLYVGTKCLQSSLDLFIFLAALAVYIDATVKKASMLKLK